MDFIFVVHYYDKNLLQCYIFAINQLLSFLQADGCDFVKTIL